MVVFLAFRYVALALALALGVVALLTSLPLYTAVNNNGNILIICESRTVRPMKRKVVVVVLIKAVCTLYYRG